MIEEKLREAKLQIIQLREERDRLANMVMCMCGHSYARHAKCGGCSCRGKCHPLMEVMSYEVDRVRNGLRWLIHADLTREELRVKALEVLEGKRLGNPFRPQETA